MIRITFRATAVTVVAFLATGCAKTETDTAADSTATAAAPAAATATPNTVNFTAKEFAFEGPDTIPSGLTAFHLTGAGKELHHLSIIKLDSGKTLEDLQAAFKKPGPPPKWLIEYGGVNPPAPGESVTAMQVMEPGNYVAVCFVESPDHVPHMAKGMMKALTVVASPNANMTEPTPDVTLTLSDYAFTLSKPLAAGKQMIKVENTAAQPHEVVLVQLQPGKTIEDLGKWVFDMKGPPPGKPIGGIPGFVPGKTAYFEADLAPGDYGMICFIPDAKDQKPHVAHGMAQQFKIT
jgi:hypothetical protein